MAATQDFGWLSTGIRLLRTMWAMKNTRLCIINGDKTEDKQLDVIGTTLHYVPLERWTEELAKLEVTAEVKALADRFTKKARRPSNRRPRT